MQVYSYTKKKSKSVKRFIAILYNLNFKFMKKMFLVASMAIAAGFGAFICMDNPTSNGIASNLILANIEALADGENDPMCTFSKVSLNEDKHKVKCSGSGHQCCILR